MLNEMYESREVTVGGACYTCMTIVLCLVLSVFPVRCADGVSTCVTVHTMFVSCVSPNRQTKLADFLFMSRNGVCETVYRALCRKRRIVSRV